MVVLHQRSITFLQYSRGFKKTDKHHTKVRQWGVFGIYSSEWQCLQKRWFFQGIHSSPWILARLFFSVVAALYWSFQTCLWMCCHRSQVSVFRNNEFLWTLLSSHKDGCDLKKQLSFGAGDAVSSFRDIGALRPTLIALVLHRDPLSQFGGCWANTLWSPWKLSRRPPKHAELCLKPTAYFFNLSMVSLLGVVGLEAKLATQKNLSGRWTETQFLWQWSKDAHTF